MPEALAQLKSEDVSAREQAARALGEAKDRQAVPALIAALGDPEASVRWTAAGALGKIGDARAVEPLIAALGQHLGEVSGWDFRVRMNIRGALSALNPDWGQTEAAKAILPAAVSALTHEETNSRSDAAEILGKLADARAITPLLHAVLDQESTVRSSAHEALGKVKGWWATDAARTAVPALTRALESPINHIRVTAELCLKRIMTGSP
jgi:hypothetical protein